jgi:hypothetical protein
MSDSPRARDWLVLVSLAVSGGVLFGTPTTWPVAILTLLSLVLTVVLASA